MDLFNIYFLTNIFIYYFMVNRVNSGILIEQTLPMKILLHITTICWLLLSSLQGNAQSITGTWEGVMDDEWLQLNIRQEGNKICGFTYDYLLMNKKSHCMAYFEGYYDKTEEYWVLNGTGFYENEGQHVLMRMKFWLDKSTTPHRLRGVIGLKNSPGSYMGISQAVRVSLSKTSNKPNTIPGSDSPCFEPEKYINKEKEPQPEAPKAPETPVKPKPPVVKAKPRVPVKPSVKTPAKPVRPQSTSPQARKPATPAPVIRKKPVEAKPKTDTTATLTRKDSVLIKPITQNKPAQVQKLFERKNKEMSRLVVNVRNINIKVYDNGVVDNDTVSIYYNGKLLVNKKRLTEDAINLNITLDEESDLHKITMYAENLGSIPPNTALVVVTAGKKRYELFSSANLEENAVLVFEYKPDE